MTAPGQNSSREARRAAHPQNARFSLLMARDTRQGEREQEATAGAPGLECPATGSSRDLEQPSTAPQRPSHDHPRLLCGLSRVKVAVWPPDVAGTLAYLRREIPGPHCSLCKYGGQQG